MSNRLNYIRHIFPVGGKQFCKGGFSPLVTGLVRSHDALCPALFLCVVNKDDMLIFYDVTSACNVFFLLHA